MLTPFALPSLVTECLLQGIVEKSFLQFALDTYKEYVLRAIIFYILKSAIQHTEYDDDSIFVCMKA